MTEVSSKTSTQATTERSFCYFELTYDPIHTVGCNHVRLLNLIRVTRNCVYNHTNTYQACESLCQSILSASSQASDMSRRSQASRVEAVPWLTTEVRVSRCCQAQANAQQSRLYQSDNASAGIKCFVRPILIPPNNLPIPTQHNHPPPCSYIYQYNYLILSSSIHQHNPSAASLSSSSNPSHSFLAAGTHETSHHDIQNATLCLLGCSNRCLIKS